MVQTITPHDARSQKADSIQSRVRRALNPEHRLHLGEFIDRVEELLEGLPLATSDYDLARSRIRNARRYLVAGEPGAAGYEIHLLIGLVSYFAE